ncbi:hemagglutinin repeat-containing protein [Herbaspirillum huttiense]|uniref:hemagglutinin repeat-containing protein n=1 Tax=Herbaspirillum huttiense TaxID=863372 RepID=UPI002176C30A|nr:hemagglutinin repeat-containing protein [Herbaspirillum huttiense]UWE18232.1 hemagglutinin repeat-containing protein [Herbaspirillum huttiense]
MAEAIATAGAASIRIAHLDLTLPNNALFRINAGPAQRFLVQTDPQFVGTRSWLSSDFMLNQLGLTASVRQLGDGFYEQQLIQRQVQQITGQRYLAGYSSNEAQYQALMNAGVQVAQSQRYTLGVALTDAQIAELKTDIVWLVKQTVTLADGSTQEVLVPQVYIHASNVQVTGQGTLIAGNDVAFQAAQDIVNSGGTIAGRQSVSLAGNNVQNLGGRISGTDVTVAAAQDINNIGGAIDARNTLVASAGRDINSAATTVATANAVTSGTNINQNASMSVSESNGSLTAVAGRDINLKASSTSADNVTLVAQRDVNLSTVHETSQEKITWDNNNRAEVNRDNAIGSTIQGKEISVTAIRATGGGTDSNITIAGSDINAKGNLALKADNDINLIASQNTDEQHGDRSSSSWGVGFTAQFGSQTKFGFTANAAGSRGNSDGKDVSNVMTQVRAGGQVNIDSGRDTNLIGATVSGDKVVANVGRDLNIASVQDTSTFKSRDQSIGGSATIGYGSGASVNASRSRVDADYASVGQQAGIMAGDGGFQINVKGNTDLKGAQIASTDKAVEEGKNSLTTGTLTSSDIQNRSQYSAESQSVSAGTSGGKPGGGAGIGNASGSETSVTRSGVSGGAVKITDAQAQQAKTGQSPDQVVASLDTSVRTGKDSSNSLAKNWDGNELREDVEAQAKITQAFGQQAAKMVGTYADQKEKELRLAASKAAQDGDQAQSDALSAEAEKWKEGGAYRAGAHSAIGLLAGGVSGALGAAASSALMPDIAEQIKKLGLPPVVESAVALAAAAGVGAAVGGGAGAASAYNVDLNNRQLHMVTYLRLREGCRGSSSAECQTINRMMGVRSGMPVDDPLIPASKVVTNYDSNNSIVSYILIDNNSGRPKMIMEPLEYAAYRNSPVGIQALMELSPQYSLDFASAGIYAAAGDNGRAREHLLAGVTSRDYARDVALSIVGGVASRLGGAVTEAESAAEIAAGLKSRSGNIEASANSARNQYYGDGNGAAPSPVGNASGSSGRNIKWPSGSGTNSASAIDEGAALSASGKLSNLYPGDPAMPGPRYKLMQTVSGDFKYQMPNGDLRTPKGTFDFVQVNGEIRIAPPKNDPDVSGHLSLSKGADVDYAGTIQFSQSGKIKFWDNDSGHYQPPAKGAAVVKLPPNLFKPIGD